MRAQVNNVKKNNGPNTMSSSMNFKGRSIVCSVSACCLYIFYLLTIHKFSHQLKKEKLYLIFSVMPEWEKQLMNLNGRVKWLKYTLAFASFGFLFNMLTVFALYLDMISLARIIFGSCCLAMIISVLFFIRDIHLSTETLKLHLSDMKIDLD